METITINAPADFFRQTIDEARQTLSSLLRSLRGAELSEAGDWNTIDRIAGEIAGVCGVLGWLRGAVIPDPEAYAETMYRAAPAPIPSERPDYSDLLDINAAHDPWGDQEEEGGPGRIGDLLIWW